MGKKSVKSANYNIVLSRCTIDFSLSICKRIKKKTDTQPVGNDWIFTVLHIVLRFFPIFRFDTSCSKCAMALSFSFSFVHFFLRLIILFNRLLLSKQTLQFVYSWEYGSLCVCSKGSLYICVCRIERYARCALIKQHPHLSIFVFVFFGFILFSVLDFFEIGDALNTMR